MPTDTHTLTLLSTDAHLVSFGGTQSNAMLAIAQVAHAKRVPFSYLSRPPAATTTSSSGGNLERALALGMRHVTLSQPEYASLTVSKDLTALSAHCCAPDERTVLIPQGAACAQARDGLAQLADEINAYIATQEGSERFAIVVPCGTGTTALYLAQHLDNAAAQLFAVPCVGDAAYLAQQFHDLVERDVELRTHQTTLTLPTILQPKHKARFGRLSWPLFAMHRELLDATGIEFDLNYGAFAWHTMFDDASDALAVLQGGKEGGEESPREVLYVHTGGVSGNATMMERYLAKGRPPVQS